MVKSSRPNSSVFCPGISKRSQKEQVLLVLMKLNARRTKKIHGEEEHRACAVREDTVTPRFPWWRSTHQGSMGKHVTLTKGDHRQAAAFFHGCCPWN